jgi:hypothetical protein
MKEAGRAVQRKKAIRQIRERPNVGNSKDELDIGCNTNQCVPDAIGVDFLLVQARAFAKRPSNTRTYSVCIHPTVLIRKQPTHGEVEKVSGKRIA